MTYWGLLLRQRGLSLQRAEDGKRRDADQFFDEPVDQMSLLRSSWRLGPLTWAPQNIDAAVPLVS